MLCTLDMMPAGAVQVSAEERAEVPHHLLDMLEPTEKWTVWG